MGQTMVFHVVKHANELTAVRSTAGVPLMNVSEIPGSISFPPLSRLLV